MKKVLVSLFFFCSILQSESQSWIYHPFPVDSALWRENSGDWPCTCCRDYQLTIDGDTLVSGLSYHKLKWHGVIHTLPNTMYGFPYDYWGCGSNPMFEYLSHGLAPDDYSGAYREDIPAKKIYYLPSGQSTDTLLYNFNLMVGDTLPKTYNNLSYAINVVNSIDSVIVGSAYHKRFNIFDAGSGSSLSYVSLIEGVGSTFGLYAQLVPPFEGQNILNCFWANDSLAYPVGAYCFPLTVGLTGYYAPDNNISLYPNPSFGKFQVSISGLNYSKLEITDVLGEITYHTVVKNKITELDLSDKVAGIYFLKLYDSKGNVVIKKIIKQ